MTPNHGYTPIDDRRREQGSVGQQPAGEQPPQQPIDQGQWAQQTPPQQIQGTQQTPPQQTPGTQQMQGAQPGQPLGTQQAPPPQGSSGAQQQPRIQQPQQSQTGGIAGQQQLSSQSSTQGAPGVGQGQYGQPAGVQSQRPGPRQPMLNPIRVNEVITEDVVTAERDTPVRTVVAKMAEHNVGSVIVVEEDRPIGIITDRKVALALEETADIADRTADELLHGDVFTADPSMSIFDAIQVMSDEGIRRLPIVDDNGALRGIVTLDDALVLLGGVVSEVADTVQSQSRRL